MNRARDKWSELLLVLMAGYLFQIMRQVDWMHFRDFFYRIWTGAERATFGFSTNRFGLFSAVVLLACLLLYRQLWGSSDKKNWYLARIGFWAMMCLISLSGIVFSQSRSAWAAAFLVTIVTLLYRSYQMKKLNLKLVIPVILAILLVFTMTNGPKVLERRGFFRLDSYVTGINSRLRLFNYGVEQWKEHPLVGHGPGTSRLLISRSGENLIAEREADHFHNVLIDTMVQTGIIGIGFHFLMLFLIFHELLKAKKFDVIDKDVFLFCMGGVMLMVIAGISAQPIHSPHGVYLLGFLGGICYSFKFASTNSIQTPASHPPTPNDVLTS
jgi:O-antigen ligase